MLPLILAVLAADSDLLARLQKRDPDALAELYDRYGRMVYGLIVRVVQDSGIAEDLVQETFLRVWNRASAIDSDRGSTGPWLLAVARNRAIDWLRAHGRRSQATVEFNEAEHPALFRGLPERMTGPEVAKDVKAALARLSSGQRQAIEMAYFEGMSQVEIAERMGQPLGTVKTWMRRALQQMRAEMGGSRA
jgi:RNA polymerase sigma-70 factor (ECF subfamily)